jgi:hypothetical protein
LVAALRGAVVSTERDEFHEEVELVVQDWKIRNELGSQPPPRDRGRFSRRTRFRDVEETQKDLDSRSG